MLWNFLGANEETHKTPKIAGHAAVILANDIK
jgi:hypothetical protein